VIASITIEADTALDAAAAVFAARRTGIAGCALSSRIATGMRS